MFNYKAFKQDLYTYEKGLKLLRTLILKHAASPKKSNVPQSLVRRYETVEQEKRRKRVANIVSKYKDRIKVQEEELRKLLPETYPNLAFEPPGTQNFTDLVSTLDTIQLSNLITVRLSHTKALRYAMFFSLLKPSLANLLFESDWEEECITKMVLNFEETQAQLASPQKQLEFAIQFLDQQFQIQQLDGYDRNLWNAAFNYSDAQLVALAEIYEPAQKLIEKYELVFDTNKHGLAHEHVARINQFKKDFNL